MTRLTLLLMIALRTCFAGVGSIGGTPYSAFEPEVLAYASNIVSASATISFADASAVDRFAKAAKANGYWTKLLEVGPMAGDSLTAARVKLKAYTGISTLLTNVGFVSGDYIATVGITGGSSKYLRTGFNANSYGNQNIGLGVFVNDEFIPGTEFPIGLTTAVSPFLNFLFLGGSGVRTYNGSSSANIQMFTVNGWQIGAGKGFYHSERASSTSFKTFFNGVLGQTYTSVEAPTPANQDIYLMAGNAGGSAGSYFTNALSFYTIDDGTLSDANALSLANDVRQLERELRRYLPRATPQYKTFVIGQSLAVGSAGNPALTMTQPYHNRGFSQIAYTRTSGLAMLNFTPLAEQSQETIMSSMANLVGSTYRASHPNDDSQDLLVSNWGVAGADYNYLKKGGTAGYADSILAVSNAVKIIPDYASSVIVGGILCVHGEADIESTNYAANIRQWQSDYQSDVQAQTGQSAGVPIFHTQPSAWTSVNNANFAYAASPFQILQEYKANPTKTILVGPKYMFTYAADGVHLTNSAYRWCGEYYAKAWYQVVVQGGSWSPLYPTNIVRSGANIDLTFSGAVGDLVLDTSAVSDPGSYGFEYFDDTSPPSIASVTVTGANTVRVTLSGTPTGSGKRIRYAYTGTAGNSGGPTTGPRGCLRDSDTTFTSNYGNTLYNWCVHFDEVCP
jgi:hypothetical protein